MMIDTISNPERVVEIDSPDHSRRFHTNHPLAPSLSGAAAHSVNSLARL